MSANVLAPGVAGLMSVSVAIRGLGACGQLYLQRKSLQSQMEVWEKKKDWKDSLPRCREEKKND